jgi:ABC-type transport system involved in multi-copper enzyme maturation permease subunit
MVNLNRSIPLFEPLLDRIGDRNPQLMRELRGQLKPLPILGTVGVAIVLHGFVAFLYFNLVQSGSSDILSLVLLWYRFLSPITIVIACHQLIGNLAGEVKQGTINPLRLSPQSSGKILAGKMLGVPVFVYLFNLLCLPLYEVVNIAAGVSFLTIATTIIGDSAQMLSWLATSLYIGLDQGKHKSVSTSLGTLFVGFCLLIQNSHLWPSIHGVLSFALTGVWGSLFWQWANHYFCSQRSGQRSAEPQQQPTQLLQRPSSSSVGDSVATPRRAIGFLDPVLDRIGDLNPQLMRELRGKLTSSNVLSTLFASIVFQGLILMTNLDGRLLWLMGLQQFTIVLGCYQLIKNWTIEEEQGTFNPLRLSPQSAWSIVWGKFLGVPSLIYLFNLSCLLLYLMSGGMEKIQLVSLLVFLAISAAQTGFWLSASLLFASLSAKIQGSKALSGAVLVGFCLIGQFSMNYVLLEAATIRNNLGVCFFILGGLGGMSYLCWQAIGRRFHRPDATFGSKGQTYGVTAIVTALSLTIGGLDSLSILFYLILVQGLVLIQPRQILLDWASQPAAILPLALPAAEPVRASLRQSNYRQDLIWGESSPPLVAIGIHVAIVAAGLSLFGLFHLDSIGQILAEHGQQLGGMLLQANWLMLILGFIQLVRLRVKRSGAAQTFLILFCIIYLPSLVLSLMVSYGHGSGLIGHPLWLLTFSPNRALIPSNLGPAIAVLCLQGTGLVMGSRQLDRDLRRLSQSEFSRALEPAPTRPQEP